MVDDLALSVDDEATAREIFDIIGRKLQMPDEDDPPFTWLGLVTDYNGVDVNQCKEYIELHCSNYIDRVVRSHG